MARGAGWPAVLAAAAVLAGMPGAASAADGTFRITDPRVTESSGLALSRAHPHTVWTANDSGDSARVFAVDTRTGKTVGVHASAAPVWDVEALAIDPDGRVLVGDIGDNTASRQSVRVYWFDEPRLGDTTGDWASWELVYPDGPHDAEALAVNPLTGRVYIVTKGQTGAVYALPATPRRQGVNLLERVGPAPARATDAVFLPDGSSLVVRTYTRLFVLDATSLHQTASALLPLQPQGETLALAPSGEGLLAGSEGRRSLVQQVALPAPGTPTPTSAPTATAPPGVSLLETPLDLSTLAARPSAAERASDLLVGPAGVLALLAALVGLGLLARRTVRARRH